MKTAGIKELKNQLSSYLTQKTSLRRALQPLIVEGIVNLPIDRINRDIPSPVKLPGKQVSEMISEDRR
ncbi:MAG: hypothetical protein U9Q84_02935 [Thermodesulfobacteriota bacterium]|nr:hypothetical protein [Thermodesulfobacteriota bacterium]